MEDATTLLEVYIPQKLKAFMSEPQGCALVAALEGQFQCYIAVINDALTVSSVISGEPVDITQIEKILRDVWQKRDIQLMIREAALNASCTHICNTLLPRAYCAVVFFFSSDFKRRSRCDDIIIDHFTGRVTMFGAEQAVNMARELMIECLTDHFGFLEIEIPFARRTTRMGYNLTTGTFKPEIPAQQVSPNPFFNAILPMSEQNVILSSAPHRQTNEESVLSPSIDNHLIFGPDFSIPTPLLQENIASPKTSNVEKIKQWIPASEVGKILGNRAAMKKQIESQFNCVITVHTEVLSQFGMTAVEIMAQNQDQCQGARSAVLSLMQSHQDKVTLNPTPCDSGINSPASTLTSESPSSTPEKKEGRHFRSSFRDQPKVMLALTPRKMSSSND